MTVQAPERTETGSRSLLARLRTSALARNASVLYAGHVLGLVVPLATVPYLARVLGPAGWGPVVFAQSLGAWLALVVEYGFDLSGTREVARTRKDRGDLSRVAAGVQGAKLLVALPAQLFVLGLLYFIPTFRDQPALLWGAWGFALARGLTPAWYFFGLERMAGPAFAESAARVLAAAGVFVWIQEPGDGWKVLALQAGFMAVAVGGLTVAMYREIRFRVPRLPEVLTTLRTSAGVFVFRSASGLYLQANAFVLGLLAPPVVIAFFGGAEKIIRGAVNLLHPLSQAFFPRLSHLALEAPERATRVFRLGFALLVGLGLVMGVMAFVGAPYLVRILLGPGYEEAVPVLRLLAALPPLIAVGTVFGIQWALPSGLERPFYLLVLAAGLLNLALALFLVPSMGALGMALSVTLAEVVVASGLVTLFHSRGGRLWPLRFPTVDRS